MKLLLARQLWGLDCRLLASSRRLWLGLYLRARVTHDYSCPASQPQKHFWSGKEARKNSIARLFSEHELRRFLETRFVLLDILQLVSGERLKLGSAS